MDDSKGGSCNHAVRLPFTWATKTLARVVTVVCFLLLAYNNGCQAAVKLDQHGLDLKHCLQQSCTFQLSSWQQSFVEAKHNRPCLAKVWWPKPRDQNLSAAQQADAQVTLVTHLSLQRLPALEAQCSSWPGPISVAVYLALQQTQTDGLTVDNKNTLQLTTALLDSFAHRMAGLARCQLHMLLLWEAYSDTEGLMLYPYNVLRNYAMMQARTEWIAMVDVDLAPSGEFATDLTAAAQRLESNDTSPTVYVLPAFQTNARRAQCSAYNNNHYRVAVAASSGNKTLLAVLTQMGCITQFAPEFKVGHRATNYFAWFRAAQPYEVRYTWQYEPWFIIKRSQAALYDVRFKGYGRDKEVYVAHTASRRFRFVVLHNIWLVHMPHPHSPARKHTAGRDEHGRSILRKAASMASEAHQLMQRGNYVAQIDNTTRTCLTSLTWWNTGTTASYNYGVSTQVVKSSLVPSAPPPTPAQPVQAVVAVAQTSDVAALQSTVQTLQSTIEALQKAVQLSQTTAGAAGNTAAAALQSPWDPVQALQSPALTQRDPDPVQRDPNPPVQVPIQSSLDLSSTGPQPSSAAIPGAA